MTWTHPALHLILAQIPKTTESLVDVGCGRGIIGALCRIYREPKRLVGIDVYEPYLEFCRQYKLYDEVIGWNLIDLRSEYLPFEEKEFDVATCVEVIEHLPRDVGIKLLDELERVARRVVVTTPNCYFEQEAYDKNPYQRHVSSWSVSDFKKRGFTVMGWGMKILGRRIRYLSQGAGEMTRYLPNIALFLICTKDATHGSR